MKSAEIRSSFLEYFKSRGHTVVASSSLVPSNDPTLLFVNSGMVQFKDAFLGKEKRAYTRATTSQRSVRAGGKHNDLENVGYTARHHTFFEMLGNFSFGDYFKKDAIQFAWELLTKVYKLPPEKLWTTVYETDDEAYDLWTRTIGVPRERVVRIGDKPGGAKFQSDNFWQMADTGPCGPCSEIFYDHGPGIPGGPPGSPDADGDRYIEIWNLVFMQFNRDEAGVMHPLPKPSVDTGMGLERIAAVLQEVHSNYEIDLFQELIRAAARETGEKDLKNPSLNVIADHIRACAFLIVDGVIPGNEGRGYVLRRIIRRAIRHGYQLGRKQPFFHRLVADLDRVMGDAYPELRDAKSRVEQTLKAEEEKFAETLENGMRLFENGARTEQRVLGYLRDHFVREFQSFEEVSDSRLRRHFDAVFHLTSEDVLVAARKTGAVGNVDDFVRASLESLQAYATTFDRPAREYLVFYGASDKTPEELIDKVSRGIEYDQVKVLYLREAAIPFDGRTAFTLYDTYGFPFDLTQDLCRERGIPVDVAAYDAAMQEQRVKARAASRFSSAAGLEYSGGKTEFRGYDALSHTSKVVALYREGAQTDSLRAGDSGVVVLDQTPFYAESGGQVGDQGELVAPGGTFSVADTQKIQPDVFGHHGTLKAGALKVGDKLEAHVDVERRKRTMRNHSVTHLMHKALREVLGSHVQQKGSLVDADKTRFDFAHDKPLSARELREVELRVNNEIMHNSPTRAQVMPIEDAKKAGATMLFGEKYGDEVRVLDIGSSREFCGGTHVERTGDIGVFKLYSEGGVAAGIRRVEATTGGSALALMNGQLQEYAEIARQVRAQPGPGMVEKAVQGLLEEKKVLEKELARLRSKLAMGQGQDLAAQAIDVKGAKLLIATLEGADAKTLRETLDKLKDKLKSAAIVLAAVGEGKVSLIAGVTADLTAKVKAGELVNFVAQQVGGKGGGRPDMAQAGGTEPSKLGGALETVKAWVEQRL
ncbi:MAG: alanine--tRNA ligase [Candidatus Parcubacteria bacterium]|nr:alanine--tRNA ligase [Burkholderiales bacterium]